MNLEKRESDRSPVDDSIKERSLAYAERFMAYYKSREREDTLGNDGPDLNENFVNKQIEQFGNMLSSIEVSLIDDQ